MIICTESECDQIREECSRRGSKPGGFSVGFSMGFYVSVSAPNTATSVTGTGNGAACPNPEANVVVVSSSTPKKSSLKAFGIVVKSRKRRFK